MINLIPPAAKKKVVAEYWLRTASLWGFLVGSALFLIATLFIPLNLYVANQEEYLAAILNTNQAEQVNQQQNTALLTRANQQATILLSSKQEYTMVELLPLLRAMGGDAIVFGEIALTQIKDPVLTVNGTAINRLALVQFRDSLEAQTNFLKVDLPISNLIKESDVPFLITITLATTTPQV